MAQVDYKQNLLGVDDMMVTSTPKGWMLRIKKGVQWFNAILYGEDIKHKDVFIPKCWFHTAKTETTATPHTVYLPEFINVGNILGFSFAVNLSSDKFHFWSWDTDSAGSDINRCEVSYDTSDNSVVIANTSGSDGDGAQNKQYRLAVFFK